MRTCRGNSPGPGLTEGLTGGARFHTHSPPAVLSSSKSRVKYHLTKTVGSGHCCAMRKAHIRVLSLPKHTRSGTEETLSPGTTPVYTEQTPPVVYEHWTPLIRPAGGADRTLSTFSWYLSIGRVRR
ncbi:hypothetical protein TREES_T100011693 [Tupaia chinensis]|uniref:Uncharacterized protein n=1 Tax=Tupaia chinensis TaxID=246437 RepID=L9L133_TUPCH|nr:hypothetical protein TREES_T100011693 [Tupaia chinensis]